MATMSDSVLSTFKKNPFAAAVQNCPIWMFHQDMPEETKRVNKKIREMRIEDMYSGWKIT
jgi:hypothetical protein